MKNLFINHWREIITIVISLSSIIIAVRVAYVTYSSYILSHRPYVWVENFGYKDQNNIVVNPINVVMIKILNSPAEITSAKYKYYILNGENKEIIEEDNPINSIKYPNANNDKLQYTHGASKVTESLASNLKKNEKLIRYIRIEYKWLSSNRKYFFEGEWEYNKNNSTWDIVYQKAN